MRESSCFIVLVYGLGFSLGFSQLIVRVDILYSVRSSREKT
jgi:hypothetical protein